MWVFVVIKSKRSVSTWRWPILLQTNGSELFQSPRPQNHFELLDYVYIILNILSFSLTITTKWAFLSCLRWKFGVNNHLAFSRYAVWIWEAKILTCLWMNDIVCQSICHTGAKFINFTTIKPRQFLASL